MAGNGLPPSSIVFISIVVMIILGAAILSVFSVYKYTGCSWHFFLCLVLLCFGIAPAWIHALYIFCRRSPYVVGPPMDGANSSIVEDDQSKQDVEKG